MKNKFLTILLLVVSKSLFACGGGIWYGDYFYEIFKQSNYKNTEYIPFLRDMQYTFYKKSYDDFKKDTIAHGNINLWKKTLPNWSQTEIEQAVYNFKHFDWNKKKDKTSSEVKTYLDFANRCSSAVSFRNMINSWEYQELAKTNTFDPSVLLAEGSKLVYATNNKDLQLRYYYQIIRLYHYSKQWKQAVDLYEKIIENKFSKDEIYYYIVDQVAGCYYSLQQYEHAAYLYTNVFSNSIDRKKSAFLSYKLCNVKNADGKSFHTSLEDDKSMLLLNSLINFDDNISNINKFIALDKNDNRVELLFTRALFDLQYTSLKRYNGINGFNVPELKEVNNLNELLQIAQNQAKTVKVEQKEFWQLAASFVTFINGDIAQAKQLLSSIQSNTIQKQQLSAIYEVFTWDKITPEREQFLYQLIKENNFDVSKNYTNWYTEDYFDFIPFIIDRIGHIYFKNHQIAESYLLTNSIQNQPSLMGSITLIDSVEKFVDKPNKTPWEKYILSLSVGKEDVTQLINYDKAIYYMYQGKEADALLSLNKNTPRYQGEKTKISINIFSNNTKECYNCPETKIMEDKTYKSSAFNFLQDKMTLVQLNQNLIKLKEMASSDPIPWKKKLASYLLGNYYFNISNTGWYRTAIEGKSNENDYRQIKYAQDSYKNIFDNNTNDIVNSNKPYNLSNISDTYQRYHPVAKYAYSYYQQTINQSTDKELNARCLYMMAKCELNQFYNEGSTNTFKYVYNKMYNLDIELPEYKSFKVLKEQYGDTKFHHEIIKSCAYFSFYSNTH